MKAMVQKIKKHKIELIVGAGVITLGCFGLHKYIKNKRILDDILESSPDGTYITLRKCVDGAIWVTSNEDQIGTESRFNKITNESEQMLIALADFLGYEPSVVLNLEE